MASRVTSWLFMCLFSSACQFSRTFADHNRCAAYTCEKAKMQNQYLKRSDDEPTIAACAMKCCQNYLCNAFEWVQHSKYCYFSITLLQEIDLVYSNVVLSCVLRTYKGARGIPSGFTFNCGSYTCRSHVSTSPEVYFSSSPENYREGCGKKCCDNHHCKSFYWVEKSKNCFLSKSRLVDTRLISNLDIESDICELHRDDDGSTYPGNGPPYPPYAIPMMGIIAFLIISFGIAIFFRYRQQRARRNANNWRMAMPVQRNMRETGDVPQRIAFTRRMSETDTNTFAGNVPPRVDIARRMSETNENNHQNLRPPEYVQSINVDATIMNTPAPMISGTPMYPVQQSAELPHPHSMTGMGYTFNNVMPPPPSYEFAVRDGANVDNVS